MACLGGQLLGAHFWPAELFSHFLPYYAFLWAAAALLSTGRSRYLWGGMTLLATAWLLQPWPQAPAAQTSGVRLLWYNVHLDNPDPAAETAALLPQQADVLALAEINLDDARWQNLRRHYPHGCQHQENSPFALALWAQQPLTACNIRFSGDFAYLRAQLPDGRVVYALHPPPPVNGRLAEARRRYLQQTAAEIAAETAPVMALGDFNTSPFSPLLRRFTAQTGLQPQTPYWQPTWRPFFINIDHVLSRTPAHSQALPWQYSDHRPLLVVWPKP